MLGAQLHISSSPVMREQVTSVANEEEIFRKKPRHATGLWTSTWRESTQDSAWVAWCQGTLGDPYEDSWFLLVPHKDATLFVIDSLQDLRRLMNTYPYESRQAPRLKAMGSPSHFYQGIDFMRLAQDYDGLHLTERGNGRLHLSYPLDMNAWDCESTVWFHWCFTDVRCIEPSREAQRTS